MKNKKLLTLILAVVVMSSLVGCTSDKNEVLESTQAATVSVVTEQTSETVDTTQKNVNDEFIYPDEPLKTENMVNIVFEAKKSF